MHSNDNNTRTVAFFLDLAAAAFATCALLVCALEYFDVLTK